jgi:hypothetical protein
MKQMGRARASAVVTAAGLWVAGAAAADPPAPLVQALQRTDTARSADVSFTEHVVVGSANVTVRLRGIEQPPAKAGSFVFSISPAQAVLGQASEIMLGSRVYVHYGLLDRLHAKNPAVKRWLVVDSRSSLGVDPAGLTALGSSNLKKMTGFKVVGNGSEDGVPVTRYQGVLALGQATASPEFQALLAHLPSASAPVLRGTARIEFSVGKDGYVHRVRSTIDTGSSARPTAQITIDATLTNFNQNTSALVPPPASDVMSLATFNRLMGVPAPTNSALLGKLVLKASQVGSGYVLSQIPGGRLVQGEATLDYCGLSYPSERLRTARLQVQYTRRGASYKASNEVVTYSAGGAQQALAEARHAATACPQGALKNAPGGVTDLVHHSRVVTDPRLLPGAVAILDHETATVHGKRMTIDAMEVYQVRGNVLSGVYGAGGTGATVEATTLRAAEHSAANLRRFVSSATH